MEGMWINSRTHAYLRDRSPLRISGTRWLKRYPTTGLAIATRFGRELFEEAH